MTMYCKINKQKIIIIKKINSKIPKKTENNFKKCYRVMIGKDQQKNSATLLHYESHLSYP